MVSEHRPIRTASRSVRASDPANDESDALYQARSRALIDLLNDLRTPLMMIKSPLQTGRLGEDALADDLLEQANRVQRGLEKALEILELDLLDPEDESGGTDLANTADRYVSSLRPLADRCGVTVQYSSNVSRAIVRMHLPKVQHLFETATESVVRSTPVGGTVRVTLSADRTHQDSGVVLEIGGLASDAPSEDQISLSVESNSRLALARHHVVQCGGELSPTNTGYCISIPASDVVEAAEGVEAREMRSGSEASAASSNRSDSETTVLIVDDHPGTRTYLRYALRKHHRVLEASDGKAALEMVREYRPDLVLSDIMMPVMDGNELCSAIKSDDSLTHIPVFLVTANAMPSVKARGLECGADDYLVKPFDVDEAVMRINNEIKSRSELRRRYSREIVIKPSDISVTSEDEALIQRATEIVESNMEDGDFSVQDLASEIGLSSRQLQRRLREIADQSPVEFIRKLRLQRAAQLLQARYGNVSEVAYRVGFTSLSYFAKCFKEEFGESPSIYKDQNPANVGHSP